MQKIIRISSLIIAGVLALVIAVAFIWFSSDPTYVIQISIETKFSNGIDLTGNQKIVIYKSKEPLIYNFTGSVDDPIISTVLVSHRSPINMKFFGPESFKISKSNFFASIALVPSGGSINGDVSYAYYIDSGNDNSRLSHGEIQLRVKEIIPGTSPWGMVILGAIGLLASLAQIIQLFMTE